jgi:hypothetical protein
MKQLSTFSDKENYWITFIGLRKQIGILDKSLAFELGISTRAMTERVTGRAEIKRETLLAMEYLLKTKVML